MDLGQVMQPLLLHGVGGDVVDQAPSKAWLEFGCLYCLEILHTAQLPEPPSGSVIWSLRIRFLVEQILEFFPFPPNPL